jgi:hypothetical protein
MNKKIARCEEPTLSVRLWQSLLIVLPLAALLLASAGCGESENSASISKPGSGDEEEAGVYAGIPHTSDQVTLDSTPLPDLEEDGTLPRSLAGYRLGNPAPHGGRPYSVGEIFYQEETTGDRRVRVFSRESRIVRILFHTPLESSEESRIDRLFVRIKEKYGRVESEKYREAIFSDAETVLAFSIGGECLITDLAEADASVYPADKD